MATTHQMTKWPNPENANTIPGSCGRAHQAITSSFSSLRVPFVPACSILRIYAHVPTRYHERILWTLWWLLWPLGEYLIDICFFQVGVLVLLPLPNAGFFFFHVNVCLSGTNRSTTFVRSRLFILKQT
jgi:hypothetical protein